VEKALVCWCLTMHPFRPCWGGEIEEQVLVRDSKWKVQRTSIWSCTCALSRWLCSESLKTNTGVF